MHFKKILLLKAHNPSHLESAIKTNVGLTKIRYGKTLIFGVQMNILLLFHCFCVCEGLRVHQTPSDIITQPSGKPGDAIQIFCTHNKTDYWVMLWYQQPPGDTAMKLIGYLYSKDVTMEEPYKNNFTISGDLTGNTAKKSSLIVQLTGQEQNAVYYCAAREAQ
ncbi:glycogen synthase kinase 3 alpha [Sarotherodon galilaeus]